MKHKDLLDGLLKFWQICPCTLQGLLLAFQKIVKVVAMVQLQGPSMSRRQSPIADVQRTISAQAKPWGCRFLRCNIFLDVHLPRCIMTVFLSHDLHEYKCPTRLAGASTAPADHVMRIICNLRLLILIFPVKWIRVSSQQGTYI